MNQPIVKICGVTDASNALACVEAGADYLGLNFHPPSPRSLSFDAAARLANSLGSKVELVGLFVDRPIVEVAEILCQIPTIGTIQLHGSEPITYLEICRGLPSHPRVIRAFRLRDRGDVASMVAYLDSADQLGVSPDAILIDALVDGQPGGTGQAIPLELLGELPGHPRLILAGGLTAENVAERIKLVRPWMVDVASGVESSPGWKDIPKVSQFIRAAKANA